MLKYSRSSRGDGLSRARYGTPTRSVSEDGASEDGARVSRGAQFSATRTDVLAYAAGWCFGRHRSCSRVGHCGQARRLPYESFRAETVHRQIRQFRFSKSLFLIATRIQREKLAKVCPITMERDGTGRGDGWIEDAAMMRRLVDRGGGLTTAQWMGRGLWFLAWIVLVARASQSVVGAEPSPVWRSDFKAALLEAEQRRLPLLVHFYADWCMPCQRMERDVFTSPKVKEFLGTHFVAVKLNSDNHQDIVRRYGVETLPSDLVIDSLTGKVLVLHSDFLDTTRYLSLATQAEARFIQVHAADLKPDNGIEVAATDKPRTGNSGPGNATSPAATPQPTKVGEVELGDPQPVVGLDGFSPVALAKHRKWTRGSARFAWDHKDVMYHFSSRAELLEFRNDPDAFAPKLLGCDPVILWETDRAVAGDIQYGAFFDGELYLFKTDERRKQFKAQPDKFIRLQHALKIDQIERTAMR